MQRFPYPTPNTEVKTLQKPSSHVDIRSASVGRFKSLVELETALIYWRPLSRRSFWSGDYHTGSGVIGMAVGHRSKSAGLLRVLQFYDKVPIGAFVILHCRQQGARLGYWQSF